jgi:hypothetical protein
VNALEHALMSHGDWQIDCYLGETSTAQIRRDIEEIKRKAADGAAATKTLEGIRELLERHQRA